MDRGPRGPPQRDVASMLQSRPQTKRPSQWQVCQAPDYAPSLEAELPRQATGSEVHFAAPNVEVTGPERRGALAARRNMDNERIAARAARRGGSG
jgi:hypothetical protein